MPNIQRSRETESFLDARQHTAPEVVSACEGWTAHEVTAHLTAAAAEISRHLEPYLQGDAVPTTRTFEQREPPYRAIDDVAKFLPYMRNEFALHRWDFVGDDDVSTELLGQPELTEHAVSVFGRILLRRGADHNPAPDQDLHVRLRAGHGPDVRLVVEAGQAELQLADSDTDEPYVDLDPAARTLVIWGRRPDQRGRFRSHVNQPTLSRLQALLSGY